MHDRHAFGFDGSILACIDLEDRWQRLALGVRSTMLPVWFTLASRGRSAETARNAPRQRRRSLPGREKATGAQVPQTCRRMATTLRCAHPDARLRIVPKSYP